jgi:hypothetical protein
MGDDVKAFISFALHDVTKMAMGTKAIFSTTFVSRFTDFVAW